MRLILATFLVLVLIETSFASSFLPNAFEGKFKQEKIDLASKRKISSYIEIKYSFPNNINFKTLDETETQYICNSSKVWVYNPPFIPGEKGTVKVGNSSKFCFSKIFDILKNGLKDNSLYTVKSLKKNIVQISFEAKAKKQLDLSRLKLEFSNEQKKFSQLVKITLFKDEKSSPVSMTTQSLKVKKSLPDSNFIFEIPKNTNIQEMK